MPQSNAKKEPLSLPKKWRNYINNKWKRKPRNNGTMKVIMQLLHMILVKVVDLKKNQSEEKERRKKETLREKKNVKKTRREETREKRKVMMENRPSLRVSIGIL